MINICEDETELHNPIKLTKLNESKAFIFYELSFKLRRSGNENISQYQVGNLPLGIIS